MTNKPEWTNDRSIRLKIALQLIRDGMFTPVYQSVERAVGPEKTAELFEWLMFEKERQESGGGKVEEPNSEPISLVNAIQVCSNAGNNVPGLADIKPIHQLRSAEIKGDKVWLDYTVPDSYWSGPKTGQKARLHVYWVENGQVYGGHFEWLRQNGQKDKLVKNMYSGYLNRRPVGQLYFVIISNDLSARTNIVAA